MSSNLTRRTNFYMNEEINKTFTGTVDQLLEHCSNLNFDISDEEVKARERESALKYIMDSQKVDREEAIEIYNMIALQEVKETVDKLVSDGLLEITEYGEDGEPKFGLTSLGNQCANEIKNQDKQKKTKKSKKKK